MTPFSPNFKPDASKYYSQAPEGQSLGKCNVIPCLGSPVFVIDKAHQWISQQFDIANRSASVKMVSWKKNTEGASYNSVQYHLVFELANYFGSKYIGLIVDSPIQGLGSAKYLKFIMNSDLDKVLEIVGLSRAEIKSLNCGDQKMIYSYYNRGDASQIPYGYAGKNFNQVSEAILDEIHKTQSVSKGRQCQNSNYERLYNAKTFNFFRDETELVTPPLRENFYCDAKGAAIHRIRIGCRVLGNYQPDNFEAFQLVTREKDGSLKYGPIQGDTGINSRYWKDINLTGSSEVAIEFWGADQQDPDLSQVQEEIRIVTYDARGKTIDEVRCGEYFDHHRQGEVRVSTRDFLGFWYNFDGDRNIQRLGAIVYKN